MNRNVAIVEYLALVGTIDPASQAAGTYLTAAINTNLHGRLLFSVSAGVVAGGGTLTFSLLASTTAGGTYVPVTGLTAAPVISVSGNKVLYELRTELLQSLGFGPFVKGQAVVATAAVAFDVQAWGASERYLPASDYNITAVQAAVIN